MKFILEKTRAYGANEEFDVKQASNQRHRGDKENSGNNEADFVANIYDLEGNYYEYTMTAIYDDSRMLRGGNAENIVSASSVASEWPNDSSTTSKSSRSVLYMAVEP